MKLNSKFYVPALALILAASQAAADDMDVDVIGPSTRSSVAIADNDYHYSANQRSNQSGLIEGNVKQSINTLSVSGIWALDPQLNLTWSLPYALHNSTTSIWQATVQRSGQTGLGGALGISATFYEASNAPQGFKLTAYAGLDNEKSENALYFGMIQPQYKFSDQFTLASSLGQQHESNGLNDEFLNLNLIWHVSPALTLTPSANFVHYEAFDTYSSVNRIGLGLSATYHLDRTWSISAQASYASLSDQVTHYYINDLTNTSAYNVKAGIRYRF